MSADHSPARRPLRAPGVWLLAAATVQCTSSAGGAGGGAPPLLNLLGMACAQPEATACTAMDAGISGVAACDGAVWQAQVACAPGHYCAKPVGGAPVCIDPARPAAPAAATADAGASDAGPPAPADVGSADAKAVPDTAKADVAKGDVSAPDVSAPDLSLPDSTAPPPDVGSPKPDIDPVTPDVPAPVYPMPAFSMVDVNPASPTYKLAVTLQMFAGKRIVVLNGAGWCPSCVAQTKSMEKIRAALVAQGRDDFALVVINDTSANNAANQKTISTGVKVPVVQATAATNGWKIMGGIKNDGFFFDSDGKFRGKFQGAGTVYLNIWEQWITTNLGAAGQPTTGWDCGKGGAPGQWAAACFQSGK